MISTNVKGTPRKHKSRESSGFNDQIMTQDSDFDSVVYGYYNDMYVLNCN